MKRLLPTIAFVWFLLGGYALAETLTFTTYYHNDHLGNPVAATDERGDLLWRAHFTPYGERHENPADNAFGTVGYTGHAQDKSSGLVYMGTRYYDPVIGRFMAVDPVGFQDQNPQSFGRYLYANNNPHKYMDPDGRSPLLLFWAGAAAFGGAMVHSDYANAPAQGEEPATMSTFDHLGALPSLQGAKGAKFLGMADEAKVAKSAATSNAARKEAMRDAGIPTSQQPVSQSRNASGHEYSYDVPAPGGGTQRMSVQQQTMDRSHPEQAHWEAGRVKTDPVTGEVRENNYGRPALANDKSKVDY